MDRLPKKIKNPGSQSSKCREKTLRRDYPLPDRVTTISTPCIIVDVQGIVLAWYLPGILTSSRQVSLSALPDHNRNSDSCQNAMLAVREKLRLLLRPTQSGSTWRNNPSNFNLGEDLISGSETFSPAWFQQGHDVSASAQSLFLGSSS